MFSPANATLVSLATAGRARQLTDAPTARMVVTPAAPVLTLALDRTRVLVTAVSLAVVLHALRSITVKQTAMVVALPQQRAARPDRDLTHVYATLDTKAPAFRAQRSTTALLASASVM